MNIFVRILLRYFRAFAICCFPGPPSSDSTTAVSSFETVKLPSPLPSLAQQQQRQKQQQQQQQQQQRSPRMLASATTVSASRPMPIKRPSLSLEIDEVIPILSRSTPTTPSNPSLLRVLVVDDNPLNLQIMSRLLHGKHFLSLACELKAETLDSGERALERLAVRDYDLVFMDLDMPVLSGIDVCKIIRSPDSKVLERNKRIPIVAVSADDDLNSIKLVKEVGMDGFVPKPVLVKPLKQWVEHALLLSRRNYEIGTASL